MHGVLSEPCAHADTDTVAFRRMPPPFRHKHAIACFEIDSACAVQLKRVSKS